MSPLNTFVQGVTLIGLATFSKRKRMSPKTSPGKRAPVKLS